MNDTTTIIAIAGLVVGIISMRRVRALLWSMFVDQGPFEGCISIPAGLLFVAVVCGAVWEMFTGDPLIAVLVLVVVALPLGWFIWHGGLDTAIEDARRKVEDEEIGN